MKVNPKVEKRILIEDEHLIAVRKKAGELVVSDRFGIEKNILLHQLGAYLREKGHKPDESGRDLYPVHRLDRETSGIVLFAKNKEAHRALSILFESREVKKVYWAFTCGIPDWDMAQCNIPLSRAEGKQGRGRALVDLRKGKEASTDFHVKEKYGDIAFIEAKPLTGRLHQIRVHLWMLGVPILADKAYGNPTWKSSVFSDVKMERVCLHARNISFVHPVTKEEIFIESPMDEDMRALYNQLKNESLDLIQEEK